MQQQRAVIQDSGEEQQQVATSSIATNTKVSVGASSTSVLAASASREYACFVNDSDTAIYLTLGATAVINQGIRLNSNGGSYEITPSNLYTGAVSAISSSTSKNLTVCHY